MGGLSVPMGWRQQVKYPVRVLADVRPATATRSVCIAQYGFHHIPSPPTNSSIGASHCGATARQPRTHALRNVTGSSNGLFEGSRIQKVPNDLEVLLIVPEIVVRAIRN